MKLWIGICLILFTDGSFTTEFLAEDGLEGGLGVYDRKSVRFGSMQLPTCNVAPAVGRVK